MRTEPSRRPPSRAVAAVAGVLSGAAVASACAAAPTATPAGDVVVATASSLSDVFVDLGEAFGRTPAGAGDRVTLDTGSSSSLAQRLAEGAQYDVFAAADRATMQRLRTDGLLRDEPQVFARTTLVLVVAPDDPAGVRSLPDLVRPGVRVALAAPSVPLGRYTRDAFARLGLQPPPLASRETNARAVLAKVRLGEADAGVVYRPDAAAADGAVGVVALPDTAQVTVEYPIAVPATSDDPGSAAAFVRFVLSPQGRAILTAAGFEVP
jgi:molybdate transport system substrate-binding protein